MSQPLVSILIPAYNAAKFIGKCIDSICYQTYANLQVVIVDDGSKDDTWKICDEYKSKYRFIEVYHIENGGVANARNVLLSKIEGEYSLFVDADDWIEPDMVENLVGLALSHQFDITACGHVVEDGLQTTTIIKDTEAPEIWNKDTAIKEFLLHKNLNGSLWNKLIKTSFLRGITFNKDISYGEDALVIWQILQRISKIGLIRSTFYHYRMNNESISHERFGKKKMSSHLVWEIFTSETEKFYPELHRLAKANFAVADFWLLYYAALDNYPKIDAFKLYQQNLKSQLSSIYKLNLLKSSQLILAIGVAYNYTLTSILLRKIRPTTLT